MRRWVLAVVVAAGTVCGAVAGAVAASGRGEEERRPATTTSLGETPTVDGMLAVWSAGGLPDGAEAALATVDGILSVTVVRGDPIELVRTERADGGAVDSLSDGWVIPVDALAIDPDRHGAMVPLATKKALAALADDHVLLGETSARLRGLGPGGSLVFANGRSYTVADVVPDQVVAGAEVVFTIRGGAAAGVEQERFALVVHEGSRPRVAAAIHRALADPVRVRSPSETPFLRHGDAVLTQAQIKDRFGEFAYRRRPDGTLELDAGWTTTHLVTVDLPLVGQATCHRAIVDALSSTLRSLEHEGLGSLVARDGFGGCWNPRLIAPGEAPSRHAWGIAVDVAVTKHPRGVGSVLDPRVIEAFERAGFTWGGSWLVPDAAHFEVRVLRQP